MVNDFLLLFAALVALICSIAGIKKKKLVLMVTGQLIGAVILFLILAQFFLHSRYCSGTSASNIFLAMRGYTC